MAQRYNLHLLPVLLVATFLLVGCVIASCPYGHDHSHDNELGNPHGHSDWGDEADTVEDFFQPDPDLHEAHDHAHGHAHHDHDDHSTGHNAHAHSHAHAHAHAHHDPHVHHEHHAHFGHAHGGHGHKHGHGQGQGRGQGQGEEEEESSRRRMRSAEELAEERELHDSLHDPFDDLDPHAGLFDAGLWGRAMGSSLLVSLASLICLSLVPFISRNGRMPSRVVVDALAAFGVGAMLGDTFFHQLPHAFGQLSKTRADISCLGTQGGGAHSHAHDEGGHGHPHGHDHSGGDAHGHVHGGEAAAGARQGHAHSLADLSVGMAVLGGILLFFVVEKIVRRVEQLSAEGRAVPFASHAHHHHHRSGTGYGSEGSSAKSKVEAEKEAGEEAEEEAGKGKEGSEKTTGGGAMKFEEVGGSQGKDGGGAAEEGKTSGEKEKGEAGKDPKAGAAGEGEQEEEQEQGVKEHKEDKEAEGKTSKKGKKGKKASSADKEEEKEGEWERVDKAAGGKGPLAGKSAAGEGEEGQAAAPEQLVLTAGDGDAVKPEGRSGLRQRKKGAASGKETSAAAAGEGVAEEEDKEDEKGEKKLEAGTAAAAVPPQAKGGGTSSSIAREDAPSASLLVLGYLNLFSDGVHNFTDGMALGAAFLNHGTAAGWSRMLFMLAHEIPQEVGDFGILVRSGLSVFKALALNFLSALMAVAGTAVALTWGGSSGGHSSLIEGFTAGGFIYISVAGVMPDMHNQGTTLGVTLLQLGSMAAGMGIAMVISVME